MLYMNLHSGQFCGDCRLLKYGIFIHASSIMCVFTCYVYVCVLYTTTDSHIIYPTTNILSYKKKKKTQDTYSNILLALYIFFGLLFILVPIVI